jgi:hypothetical protein
LLAVIFLFILTNEKKRKVVGEEGFEPPTLWSQTRCATKLRYSPIQIIFWNVREETLWSVIPNIRMRYQTGRSIDVNLLSQFSPRKETEVTE